MTMTKSNGTVAAEVAEQAAREMTAAPQRLRLDPDELTPRDMKRARVMLGGRNPWEVLEDKDDGLTLIIWCLKSRTDPEFTWDQAEDTPYGEFEPAVPKNPPPTEPLSSSGSNKMPSAGSSPSGKQPSGTPEPSSAASTA